MSLIDCFWRRNEHWEKNKFNKLGLSYFGGLIWIKTFINLWKTEDFRFTECVKAKIFDRSLLREKLVSGQIRLGWDLSRFKNGRAFLIKFSCKPLVNGFKLQKITHLWKRFLRSEKHESIEDSRKVSIHLFSIDYKWNKSPRC